MHEASTSAPRHGLGSFLSVAVRGRTWLNVLYLLLAMPLGTAYFVYLVTALSLGVGLAITLAGIPLLVLTLLGWRVLVAFERWLTVLLLRVDIEPSPVLSRHERPGAWEGLKALLADSLTWRGFLHLVLRFPLGLAAFVTSITLLSIVAALIAAPVAYRYDQISMGFWEVDTLPEALACAAVGLVLLPLVLHALNGLALGLAWLAQVLLRPAGRSTPAPAVMDAAQPA